MRSKTIIFTAAAASAASLVAGGVYHHVATTAPHSAGASALILASAAGGAEGERAFTFHEQPEPVPELQFVDGAGRAMTLADFKGKTVLLNLWATWCVPCREEMPSLDRLQANLGSPEFEVVPLSIDSGGLAVAKAFYQELGLTTLAVYADESGKAAQQLSAVGIPTTLLINREGQEVGRLVGPAEWDAPATMAAIRNFLPTRPDPVRAPSRSGGVAEREGGTLAPALVVRGSRDRRSRPFNPLVQEDASE